MNLSFIYLDRIHEKYCHWWGFEMAPLSMVSTTDKTSYHSSSEVEKMVGGL